MALVDSLADFFGFEEHDTNLRTEAIAGATTFLTMSYIIVVNPLVLNAVITDDALGVPEGRALQLLAVVTILSAVAGLLVMAFYANRPFGLAPGMGLNAFFVTVVLTLDVSWQGALAAVFVEGVIFILLTAVGAREYIINLFPNPVKYGVGAGIGLFLALIGLRQMRVIASDPASDFLTLNPVLAQDPVAVLSVFGILLTFVLYARGVRGAIILGILLTTVVSYVVGALGVTANVGPEPVEGITLAGEPALLAPGVDQVAYGLGAYNITPLAGAFVEGLANVEALTFTFVIFTFFFVDFFDTAGTLTGLGQAADMLDEDGELPDMDKPLMADAVGTTVGAALGTSTVTTYIESSTGIEEGGRTGMTALVVAGLFLAVLAVVPLISALPSFAPYVAFMIVAVFMLQTVTDIRWEDATHAIPAGLTIAIMPLTHSIANGIAAGIIAYPLVNAAAGELDDVRPAHWVMAAAFVVYYFVRTSVLV